MYNAATIPTFTQLSDGRLQLNVIYTGNAGESPVSDPIYCSADITSAELEVLVRREAKRKLNILNANASLVTVIGASLPYSIDTVTPLPTPPASTFGAYMAASLPFTPGATPQDVFTLANVGSKTLTLLGAGIATLQTTAGTNSWNLLARTTLNTAGTSALVTAVPTGSGYPAATAEVRQYTANPTLGTLAGRIWSGRVPSPAPATAGIGNANVDLMAALHRTSINIPPNVTLAFNFNGAALPAGLSVTAWFAWRED